MRFTIPELLQRIGGHPNCSQLELSELDFMAFYMERNAGSAFGVLPYSSPEERHLADSIAKKLKLNKFFRGPRQNYGSTHTLKENATKVALYRKP